MDHSEHLDHLPYSLDLAPGDFDLLPALKKYLGGHRFKSDEDVDTAVTGWLYVQDTTF